jgi:hypothetical protein
MASTNYQTQKSVVIKTIKKDEAPIVASKRSQKKKDKFKHY